MAGIQGTILLSDGTVYNVDKISQHGDDKFNFMNFRLLAPPHTVLPDRFILNVGNYDHHVYDPVQPGTNNFYTTIVDE